MTNTGRHAKRELETLTTISTDPNNHPIIEEFAPEIIALCDKFGKSGQSGGSAPFTARVLSQAIEKLCLQKTITPLTGNDDEWTNITNIGDNLSMFQNNRDSAVFKEGVDGKPYYIDAIIKQTENGNRYHGWFWKSKEDYLSKNKNLKTSPFGFIKSFPFTPKTFYVDVIEEEVAKDDWETYLKDPKQLDEVYAYYDKE